jgi:hypothetical protein
MAIVIYLFVSDETVKKSSPDLAITPCVMLNGHSIYPANTFELPAAIVSPSTGSPILASALPLANTVADPADVV